MIEKKGEGDTEYGKKVKCNREQPDRVGAGRFFAEKNGKQMVQSEEFHLFPAFFNFLSSNTAHADNSKPAVRS